MGWYDELPVIDDPLAWQEELDEAGISLNMRGSARFWKTVMERMGVYIYRDGAPEFQEIVFDLGNGVGLRLRAEEIDRFDMEDWHEHGSEWLNYRAQLEFAFVRLDEKSAPLEQRTMEAIKKVFKGDEN